MGDHKNEWSGNRTESSQSYWLYIFSLWARWKVLLLFSVLLKLYTKTMVEGGILWLCLWRNSSAVMCCNCRQLNRVWGIMMIPLCHQPTPRSAFCFNLSITFKNAYINSLLLLHYHWVEGHSLSDAEKVFFPPDWIISPLSKTDFIIAFSKGSACIRKKSMVRKNDVEVMGICGVAGNATKLRLGTRRLREGFQEAKRSCDKKLLS